MDLYRSICLHFTLSRVEDLLMVTFYTLKPPRYAQMCAHSRARSEATLRLRWGQSVNPCMQKRLRCCVLHRVSFQGLCQCQIRIAYKFKTIVIVFQLYFRQIMLLIIGLNDKTAYSRLHERTPISPLNQWKHVAFIDRSCVQSCESFSAKVRRHDTHLLDCSITTHQVRLK